MTDPTRPTEFEAFLGGVFWQQWEGAYDGDPAKALAAAGYPSGPESEASKSLSSLLKWIEVQADVEDKIPILNQFYDYRSENMTSVEFLVLVKRFIDGDLHAFDRRGGF